MKPLVAREYMKHNGHVDIKSLREDLFDYFNTLHYMLSDTEFDHISQFAKDWIREHLENENALESSVKAKASEIGSGDHVKDFYTALLMRRDQLLAARDVFREYTSRLRDIFNEDRNLVISSLNSFDFNSGIYLRALEYHKARDAAMELYEENLSEELQDIESTIDALERSSELNLGDSEPSPKRKSTKKTAETKKPKTNRFFHKSA